jgi:uncharacterized protein CbrC (UPF0167 family)
MPTEFLGDAGWDELSGAWAGAVSSLLADCCPGENESERAEFLRSLRAGGNPGAYVFRCVVVRGARGPLGLPLNAKGHQRVADSLSP